MVLLFPSILSLYIICFLAFMWNLCFSTFTIAFANIGNPCFISDNITTFGFVDSAAATWHPAICARIQTLCFFGVMWLEAPVKALEQQRLDGHPPQRILQGFSYSNPGNSMGSKMFARC